MAVGLEELQQLRDTLVRARAKGIRVVQMNGERIEYKSDSEMASALAGLDQQIATAGGGGGFAVLYPETGRGL